MASVLRIEFNSYFQKSDVTGFETEDPISAATLTVTSSATATGNQITVPTPTRKWNGVSATFSATDPTYVDIGSSPNPTVSANSYLIIPGEPKTIDVIPGDKISAILSTDFVAATGSNGPIVLTDRSGTIAAGGTAQQAAASNSARKFLMIHNPDTSTDLWFNTTGTASATAGSGSFRLAPGGGAIFDILAPSGAVSIFSTTTGKSFVVKEA